MIQSFADWLVYEVFGLDSGSRLAVAVNFFFYDTIKILILLFFISVLMGVINAYFPIERLRHYLATHKMYGLQYLLASLFGAITPFCSCLEKPNKFDPFGQKESAHLIYHTIAPLKVLVMGVNFILPF